MSTVALYTFGLLDPTARAAMADFSRRGQKIFTISETAPGFLGQADPDNRDGAGHVPGADFGRWGTYALPLGLPDFQGHDPHLHIATLSHWRDVASARQFVYSGPHREALRLRYDWFLKGPWPGHVLWTLDQDAQPVWQDGVDKLEALARCGDFASGFTFASEWARS